MDGFEVAVEALSDAGDAIASAAGAVVGLPLAEAMTTVGDALPGGAVGAAAAALAAVWRERVAATVAALAQHAEALRAAADAYGAAESATVAALAGER